MDEALRDATHDHVFGQDQRRPGEGRTRIVIGITAVMMVVEIAAGLAYGSMALLADGLHMGSHAAALAVTAFAYYFARQRARDPRFCFGTGKVNALGGFTGAVLLAGFAALMAVESFDRLVDPVAIVFDQAILVAIVGLLVNGASVFILGGHHEHEHEHGHEDHEHEHEHGHEDHEHEHEHEHDHDHDHDHNLRSAYLHVLADAVTSLLAIFALLAGKLFGASFLDPVMGLVGAVLVGRWSWGLLRQSGRVLLDVQAPEALRGEIRHLLEDHAGAHVTDLHVWSIGPGIYAAAVSLTAAEPREPQHYKKMLPRDRGLVHVTVEVNRPERAAPAAAP